MFRFVISLIFIAGLASINAQGMGSEQGLLPYPMAQKGQCPPCQQYAYYPQPKVDLNYQNPSVSDLLVSAVSWVAQSTGNNFISNLVTTLPIIAKIALLPIIMMFTVSKFVLGILHLPLNFVKSFFFRSLHLGQ